jgi:hypothetical protein
VRHLLLVLGETNREAALTKRGLAHLWWTSRGLSAARGWDHSRF